MMDNESEYCKELYDLVEEFQIPCPSEDIMNYLVFTFMDIFLLIDLMYGLNK